jgi:hypothetical protein
MLELLNRAQLQRLFAVDDFVAVRAHEINSIQSSSTDDRNSFNINHLRTTKFYKFQ